MAMSDGRRKSLPQKKTAFSGPTGGIGNGRSLNRCVADLATNRAGRELDLTGLWRRSWVKFTNHQPKHPQLSAERNQHDGYDSSRNLPDHEGHPDHDGDRRG